MLEMLEAAPGRVAVYGIENHAGTPVYVHAKACIIDDTWATIGSDNFNRRSWTHDSELSAVVVDRAEATYARRLRLTLAAEHLDRTPAPGATCSRSSPTASSGRHVRGVRASAATAPRGVVRRRPGRRPSPRAGCAGCSRRSWAGGRVALALPVVPALHDPDGRPRPLRRRDGF